MAWEYKREEQKFQTLPEGKYRIRIKSVDKAISKSSGNDMLQNSQTLIYFVNMRISIY